MRISVFGLGYVGAVSGTCLAKLGHEVIGVDPDHRKLQFIREGKSPILEEGLSDVLAEMVKSEQLTVTDDCNDVIQRSELSIVCVGTPSTAKGRLCTDYVERACREIGAAIRAKGSFHSVVIRSTVLPGTTKNIVEPILEEATGGRSGETFGLSMNPEFLREGTAIKDFYDPPFTVIGADSTEEYERVLALYKDVSGESIHCSIPAAEATKYGCNIFHAVKITLANEIGVLCKQAGVDAREVMQILCNDSKLNISTRYLKPGFAFGGSCLPKDLRAFTSYGRLESRPLLMFEGALASNSQQIEFAAQHIMSAGSRKVSLMGLSFKEGTDDLRESPLVALAERLIGKGYDLRIFDPNVEYAALYGSNKQFIDEELPHLKSVLSTAEDALEHGELLVFGHNAEAYRATLSRIESHHKVYDLVGITTADEVAGQYEGLYW